MLQLLEGDIDAAHGVAANQQGLCQAEDAVRTTGSKGTISFSVFDEAPLWLRTDTGERSVFIENPSHIQLHHVENMIRHLQSGTTHPSRGVEAASSNRVMSEILASRVDRRT